MDAEGRANVRRNFEQRAKPRLKFGTPEDRFKDVETQSRVKFNASTIRSFLVDQGGATRSAADFGAVTDKLKASITAFDRAVDAMQPANERNLTPEEAEHIALAREVATHARREALRKTDQALNTIQNLRLKLEAIQVPEPDAGLLANLATKAKRFAGLGR